MFYTIIAVVFEVRVALSCTHREYRGCRTNPSECCLRETLLTCELFLILSSLSVEQVLMYGLTQCQIELQMCSRVILRLFSSVNYFKVSTFPFPLIFAF